MTGPAACNLTILVPRTFLTSSATVEKPSSSTGSSLWTVLCQRVGEGERGGEGEEGGGEGEGGEGGIAWNDTSAITSSKQCVLQ